MVYVLSDEEKSDVFDVAQALGYATKWEDIHNPYLFLQALTQRSYTNEHRDAENNEILAFYGDRVLEWYVTRMLLNRFSGEGEETPWFLSDFDEDEYTNLKSKLVCRSNLAKIARYYDLGDYLRVGRGSKESETNSDNVLGELVEALIGACALDSSYGYKKKMNDPRRILEDMGMDSFMFGCMLPNPTSLHQNHSYENPCLSNLMPIDSNRIDDVIGKMLDSEQFLDEVENKEYIHKDSIIKEQDFENPKGALNKLYTKEIIDEPVYEMVHQSLDDDNRQLWKCSCTVKGFKTQECTGYFYKKSNAEANAAKKVLMEILNENPEL